MHIKDLFVRRPWGEFVSSWETVSQDHRTWESSMIAFLAILGSLATLFFLSVTEHRHPLDSSFVFWAWIVPSLIMTPFIVWRIVTRICAKQDNLRYGNFVWRDIYLEPTNFSLLHILLYVIKAYWPLLNLVCVAYGFLSIARCRFSVACEPRAFQR